MDAWTELGDGIHLRQSRAYRMNSAVMVAEDHAVLIDPGVLASELEEIAAFVARAGAARVTLILTHDHWDHVLGAPWWPGAETIAHDGFAAAVKQGAAHIATAAARCAGEHGEIWDRGFAPFTPSRAISGLHFAPIGPFRIVFRDAPGHCATQLTVHLPDEHLLFAADMLSDIEIPMLDGSIATYRRTLEGLAPLIDGGAIETLVPGHGGVAHGTEVRDRLLRDLLYLETLETRVQACRGAGLDLAATQASLAGMDYTGRDAPYSMTSAHESNVRIAYESPTQPPRRGPAGGSTRSGKPAGTRGGRSAKRRRSNGS
jgi:glyoxylase-like metal-dependent hydrolase (beta-lactamase superfamily II)